MTALILLFTAIVFRHIQSESLDENVMSIGDELNETDVLLTTMTTTVGSNGCNQDQFRCHDGKCILSEWLCDGGRDCSGGEDEREQICDDHMQKNSSCFGNQPECQKNGVMRCIPHEWLCDRHRDCDLGDDEKDCELLDPFSISVASPQGTATEECKDGTFRCAFGDCISDLLVCNGQTDCSDGSDEWQSACNTTQGRENSLNNNPDTTEVTDALTESNSDTTIVPSNDEMMTEDGQTSTHLDEQIEKSDALSASSDNELSSSYTNSFTTAMSSASSISSSAINTINTITPSSSFASSPPTLFPLLFPFLSSPPPSTSAYQPLDLSDLLTSTAHPPVPNSFSSSSSQSFSTNNPFWLPLPSNPFSSQSSISYPSNSPSESPHSLSAAHKPPSNVVKAVKTVKINLSNLKPVSYYKGVPIKPDNIWILSFLKKDKGDSQ
ncbi:hypothetical protein WR25_10862 [Diploscapter pachys]|uniref:Uncharacterized protein n=1 Tax=Diploscapter pachys TaxID=2018661 RepID=A0A2A2LQN5_9BILA|nr:hypothetical protein WR25_10862 [Diploscapter pachys]